MYKCDKSWETSLAVCLWFFRFVCTKSLCVKVSKFIWHYIEIQLRILKRGRLHVFCSSELFWWSQIFASPVGHLEFFTDLARDACILYLNFLQLGNHVEWNITSCNFLFFFKCWHGCRYISTSFRKSRPRCSQTLECEDVCCLWFFFFSPFFPFLCKVRRLNLKRGRLLCCCCNIVQRLMTACQPWFARWDGCSLSEETGPAQQHVHVHVHVFIMHRASAARKKKIK